MSPALFTDNSDAPFYAVGLGRIVKIHPTEREVDLLDLFSGSVIRRAKLHGPDLPPAFVQKELTGKYPRDALCFYAYLNNRPGRCIAVYMDSFDVDEDDEGNNYRSHKRVGGFRFLIDADGQTATIEQTKSDGNAGPTVTLDGEHVIIGDTGTAKDVARKGDETLTALAGLTITGTVTIPPPPAVTGPGTFVINSVTGGGGVGLDKAIGEITEGSDKLQIED